MNYTVCQLYRPKSITWREGEREIGREEGSALIGKMLWPVFPIKILLANHQKEPVSTICSHSPSSMDAMGILQVAL